MNDKKKPIVKQESTQPKKRTASRLAPIARNPTQIDYFKDIVATMREPLVVLDKDLRVLSANRSFYDTFKVKQKETLGTLIYDLGNRQWDIPALRTLLDTILPQKAVFKDFEVEHDFPSIGRRILLLNARRIPAPPKEAQWILLAFEDVTERMRFEHILQASEHRFHGAFDTASDSMLLVDKTSGCVLNSNRAAQHTFRFSNLKLLKMNLWELDILKDFQQFEQISEELEKKGTVEIFDKTIHIKGSGQLPADIYLMDRTGAIQCNIRDITARKRVEEALKESEERFSNLAAATSEGIVISAQGKIVDANPQTADMMGYHSNELIGSSVMDFVAPESRDLVIANMKAGIEGPYEHLALRKDGSSFPVEIRAKSILHKGHQARVTIIRDITERKQTQTLQEAVYRIAAATETTGSLDELYPQIHQIIASVMPAENFYITLYDETQNLLNFPYFKDAVDEAFVGGTEPAKGLTAYVLRTGRSLLCKHELHMELERRGELELLGVPSAIWLGVPLKADGKTVGAMVVQHYSDPKAYGEREQHMLEYVSTQVATAIRRKQAEKELHENEEKYRGLVEQSLMGIGLSHGNQVIFANPALLQIFGYDDLEEFTKVPLLDLVAPASRDLIAALLKKVAQGESQRADFEYDILCKDGKVKTLYASVTHITIGGEIYSQTAFHDITERKQAEEKLKEERILLRTLIDNIPDRIYVMDVQGRKIISNTADWLASGGKKMEDVIGKTDLDTYPPELAKDFWAQDMAVIDSGESIFNHEEPGLDPHGKRVSILSSKVPLRDSRGKVVGLVGIGRDITDRKMAEQKLKEYSDHLEEMVAERTHELTEAQEKIVRQEKLAVLGQLAGGVGHELRNPLGVINTSIYYLKMVQPKAGEKIKQHLDIIEKQIHVSDKIITDLLDFSREETSEREQLSVPNLVSRTLERFPVPNGVEVAIELSEGLPKVHADPRQMEQVLGNLVTNACQAMASTDSSTGMQVGSKLTISAKQEMELVAIAVQDTGTGITPENMKKLFEPLFTTKAKGIGLGLAVSKKLAESNGGRIEVESEPGKGSTFTLVLPVGKE